MEKIIKIESVTFKKKEDDYTEYEGYQIITDKQTIKLAIDNGGQCCENFGYFMSEDNIEEFVGASLISVEVVDTLLNTEKLKTNCNSYGSDWDDTYVMFVNINTDKGLLQFVAYNEHNGYYGHEALVISEQLNHSETL